MKPLFHVSFNGNLEGVWYPKLPDGGGGTPGKYPEPDDQLRTSVSTSVEGCLIAVFPNVSQLFEEHSDIDFHVYTVDFSRSKNIEIVDTEILTKKRFVHDAHVTKEAWIITPCYMRYVEQITVTADMNGTWLRYKPFNDAKEEFRELAPHFKYRSKRGRNKIPNSLNW